MKKPIISAIISSVLFLGFATSCSEKIEVSSDPVASTIKSEKPVLNVYIENSGSMDGYMCNGSELKDCVYDFVSDLNRYTLVDDKN